MARTHYAVFKDPVTIKCVLFTMKLWVQVPPSLLIFFIWLGKIMMGNWTRIRITGTCGKQDLEKLSSLITCTDYHNIHCLMSVSIAGLPNWARENIDVVGNLAERDYSVSDIAEQLQLLINEVPSLNVKIHIGDEYESDECIATINTVNGVAMIGEPETLLIPEINETQLMDSFTLILTKKKL